MTTKAQPRTAADPFHIFRTFLFFSLFLLFFASAQPSHARDAKAGESYALIYGTVWGPNSHPVYGVKVAIRRADDKKARWHLVSNHLGEFVQRVPIGSADYLVWPEAVLDKNGNFKKIKKLPESSTVKVHIENDERINIGLHLTE